MSRRRCQSAIINNLHPLTLLATTRRVKSRLLADGCDPDAAAVGSGSSSTNPTSSPILRLTDPTSLGILEHVAGAVVADT